tara:strand:- start:176 stop:607 length:432 start_codon:yes stop_codon:yes gene_type:complete
MKCFECDSTESIHQHHVVPRSLGGERTVPLCGVCHSLVHSANLIKTNVLTKSALNKRKSKGLSYGATPYGYKSLDGYRATNKVMEVDAYEQSVINDIVAKRKAGQTLREIASDLNERSIKPKRGKQWYASSVSYLIKRITVTP